MRSVTVVSAVLATLSQVQAHTRFATLHINGASQGDGVCVRLDTDAETTTHFVSSITSPDMACGVEGELPVGRTCFVAPGDTIGLEHRVWTDGSQPGAIDPRHLGSTAIYMKKMGDAESSDPWSGGQAQGDGWFKVFFDGFSDGLWGTERMNNNDGLVSTTIPADLEGGYYLVRSEVLALQSVDGDVVNPQVYVGCAQVFLDGSGSAVPEETVSIPGYVDSSTPAMNYNIYEMTPPEQPFEEYGPNVFGDGEAGSTTGSSSSSSSDENRVPPIGSCPANTVLEVANECYTELESWSDDQPGALPKCWAASQECWDQVDRCWENISPSVNPNDPNAGCLLWERKCTELVSWCDGGNLEGPPDAGKVLGKREVVARTARGTMGRSLARRSVEAKSIMARKTTVVIRK